MAWHGTKNKLSMLFEESASIFCEVENCPHQRMTNFNFCCVSATINVNETFLSRSTHKKGCFYAKNSLGSDSTQRLFLYNLQSVRRLSYHWTHKNSYVCTQIWVDAFLMEAHEICTMLKPHNCAWTWEIFIYPSLWEEKHMSTRAATSKITLLSKRCFLQSQEMWLFSKTSFERFINFFFIKFAKLKIQLFQLWNIIPFAD